MKKFILILGVCLLAVVMIGASSVATHKLVENKPATPQSVVVFVCYSEDVPTKTKPYISKGYIIKTISGASTGSSGPMKQVVVMEKY